MYQQLFSPCLPRVLLLLFYFFIYLVFFFLFRTTLVASGSQARGQIGAAAATATATATPDPSCIYNLHYGLWQHWVLNPLSEARDGTLVLVDTSWVHYC